MDTGTEIPGHVDGLDTLLEQVRAAMGADRVALLGLAPSDSHPAAGELRSPVVTAGRPVATLSVVREHGPAFGADAQALLDRYAPITATLLSLELDSRLQRRRLAIAHEVTAAIGSAATTSEALEVVARAVSAHSDFTGVSAVLVDHQGEMQIYVADIGPDGGSDAGIRRPLDEGVVGRVIREGAQVLLADAASDPDYTWPTPLLSILATPVMIDGRCEAVLELSDARPGVFDEDDAMLMSTIAEEAAGALRSIGLRAQFEQRAQSLAVASEVARAVTTARSIETAMTMAARTVFEHGDYRSVTAAVVDRAAGEYEIVATLDRTSAGSPIGRRPLDLGPIGQAIAENRQVPVTGEAADGYLPDGGWMLVTPVAPDGECIAVLAVEGEHGLHNDRLEAAVLGAIADQLAASLTGIRLRARADRRAERLALAGEVAKLVATTSSAEQLFAAVAELIYTQTGYASVTAIMANREAGEQICIADLVGAGGSYPGLRRRLDAGISGRAMLSGRQQTSGDVASDPDYSWPDATQYNSMIVTPVMVNGQAAGTIEVWDHKRDRFGAGDAVLMATVCEQMSTALQAVELREEAQRQADRLLLASRLAAAIPSAATLDEALELVARLMHEEAGYTSVQATRVLADTAEQVVVSDFAGDRAAFTGMRRPITQGLIGHAIALRQQIVLGRATEDPHDDWPAEPQHDSLIVTPIMIDGQCVAAISVSERAPDSFDASDAALIATVGEQIAVALRGLATRIESDQRAARLALTTEVAKAVAGADSVDDALRIAAITLYSHTTYETVSSVRCLHDVGEAYMTCVNDRRGDIWKDQRWPIGTGMTGRVIANATPERHGRASLDPLYRPTEHAFESLVQVPVVIDGRCEALLELCDRLPDRFTADDVLLLQTVAEQLAAALRGMYLREESVGRARRLDLTLDVAKAVASTSTIEEAVSIACDLIARSVECGAVTGYLRLPETGEQLAVVDIDRHGNSVEGLRRPLHAGVSSLVFLSGDSFRVGNATEDSTLAPFATEAPVHYESVLLTPVADETGVGAVLGLFDTHRDWFDADDQTLMETVAEQLAAALRGVRLRDEADRRARRLTLALDIATAVAAAPTVEAAIRGTVRTLAEGLACESIGGFLALPETGEQLAIAEIEHHGPSVEGMRMPLDMGHTGMAFTSGRQLHLRRATDIPGSVDWVEGQVPYESAIFQPVMLDGETVAVIALADPLVARFDDGDAVLLQTVAGQLSAVLGGARLRDEAERRSQRLALSLEVAQRVAGADTVDDALRIAAETIFGHAPYLAVTAIRIVYETGEEVVVADQLREGMPISGMRRPLAPLGTGIVHSTRRQHLFSDTHGDPNYVAWLDATAWRTALVTPVIVDGRCEASLALFHARPGQFEMTEHVLMQTVAEQLAAALRSIKLRTESESRARRLELLEHRHRDLLERLVRAQEQERSRVAGDLHDDTVQVLAACVISLDRVRRSIETGHVERAAEGLRAVSRVISEAVDRTRRMTFELRPAVLWHHGLVVATQQLLNGLQAETGAEVELRCDELPRLDPTVETIAFRSLSELIANVRNHAGARHVSVEIAVKDSQLTAVIADDGRGFDLTGSLERARATNHLGLEALSERIDAAGGGVTIRTAPGAGTTVSLRLPIRA